MKRKLKIFLDKCEGIKYLRNIRGNQPHGDTKMAWTTINHSCGHTSTVQLYGPGKERDRTVAYRASQECPQCWSKAKKIADEKAGPLITTRVYGDGPKRTLEIIFTRSTFPIKDMLKARGYKFGEYTVSRGFLNLMARPDKGWAKAMRYSDAAAIDAEIAWLAERITIDKWEAHIQDAISTMMASVAEGRADLVGL